MLSVPCELSGGGPSLSWHHTSRANTKTQEGDSSLPTSLNCSSLNRRKQEGKPSESAHTRGGFGYSAHRQQQSTEGAPTPNI